MATDDSGDSTAARNERLSKALIWARDNPGVRAAAHRAVETPKMAVPDVLLTNPRAIVAATESVLREAERQDAPREVISGLRAAADRFRTGAERLESLEYTVRVLSTLQGMRDRAEVEPILVSALADTPDEANREKLEHIVALVRRPGGFHTGYPPDLQVQEAGCDWGCCAFSCILCMEACIVCCAAACVLC
jgi:hypothetical protein